MKEGGVHVQPQSENRHSKVAYVEFASPQEAERALVSQCALRWWCVSVVVVVAAWR